MANQYNRDIGMELKSPFSALVPIGFILVTLFSNIRTVAGDSSHSDDQYRTKNSDSASSTGTGTITGDAFHSAEHQLALYRRLFRQNHAIQLEAVKSLQSYEDYAKQYQLVKLMVEQIFKVNGQAQANLTLYGYRPGDSFPLNETVRHAMSKVFENTALFGELVLRLPDIVHRLYDKNRDWHILLSWSVWFCNESGVFDKNLNQLLNLMSQEVNLTEREGGYVNPFTSDYQIKEKQSKATIHPVEPVKKKKKPKVIKKGPRLTSRSHGDL